jgi:hypothetical protein
MPRRRPDTVVLLAEILGAEDDARFRRSAGGMIEALAAVKVQTAAQRREQVSRMVQDLRRATRWRSVLDPETMRSLEQTIDEHESSEVYPIGMSPPSSGDQTSAARSRLAVVFAARLILDFSEHLPAVELLTEVAGKLVEGATGREPSNLDEYASQFLKRAQASGYPDARARRSLDDGGREDARAKLGRIFLLNEYLRAVPGRIRLRFRAKK